MLKPKFTNDVLTGIMDAVCTVGQEIDDDTVDCSHIEGVGKGYGNDCKRCVFYTVDSMLAFILEELEKESK